MPCCRRSGCIANSDFQCRCWCKKYLACVCVNFSLLLRECFIVVAQVDRLSIDRLLLALALSSAHVGSVASVDAEYRIAVLGALLASVNAQSCEMSPALSLAVKVFRDGATVVD